MGPRPQTAHRCDQVDTDVQTGDEGVAQRCHDDRMHPVPYQPQPYQPMVIAPPPTSGLAVASGVIGILCVLGFGCLVLPQFVAVVLGHMATRETRTGERGGHGWAITGLITGYLCVLPLVLMFGWLVLGLAAAPFTLD